MRLFEISRRRVIALLGGQSTLLSVAAAGTGSSTLQNGAPSAVPQPASQSQIGQALFPRSAAETASSVTPANSAYAPGDVRRYGADATGTADSTAAIQMAIDVARFGQGANARCVYFADGTYKTSAPLRVDGSFGTHGIELLGERALLNFSHNGAGFHFDQTDGRTSAPQLRLNAYLRGIDINGPGAANSSSAGISIGGKTNVTANVFVYDCLIQNCYSGIYTTAGISLYFDKINCQFNHIALNLDYNPSVAAGPNNTNITRSTLISNVQAIVATNFPNSVITLIDCDIEGNNVGGSQSSAPTARNCVFTVAGEVSFIGCHMESNMGSDDIYYSGKDATKTLTIQGCEMIGSCYNLVNVAQGYCVVSGSRIFNSRAANHLYLSSANAYAVLLGTETIVTGPGLPNALWAAQGGFGQGLSGQGAPGGAFTSIKPIGGVATLFQADAITQQYNNSAGSEINYFRSLNAAEAAFVTTQPYGWVFYANNVKKMYVGRGAGAAVEPGSDDTIACGSAVLRWSTVYAATGSINTSDERCKQQISAVDPGVLKAWGKVEYSQFRFSDAVAQKGNGARWHFGLVAQRVKEAFESEGLDAFAFGLLCFDKWDKAEEDVIGPVDEEILGLDGKPTGERRRVYVNTGQKRTVHEAGERYGIRYEEALALECAYLRSLLTAVHN